ncbi:DUF340 domain-containing protein [candidate division WWE3 bacterium]|nr:DUF340 domain-containing protein [candidate division WWE3 bacterium]
MFKTGTAFLLGTFGGYLLLRNFSLDISSAISYLVALLLFFVGFLVGNDSRILGDSSWRVRDYLVPLFSLMGSVLGGLLVAALIGSLPFSDALLASLGMGYYSVPSIIVTARLSTSIGSLVLLTNILREVLVLLFTPLLVKKLNRLAPIALGGTTTMDVSLPIITEYSGKDYVVPAFINGVVLTVIVPLLVSLTVSLI